MKRLSALILALVMVSASFAACAKQEVPETDESQLEEIESNSDTEAESVSDTEAVTEELPEIEFEGLTVTKLGSVNRKIRSFGPGGAIYKDENGKLGLLSFDEKSDSGAKYTYANGINDYDYFIVSESDAYENEASDVEDINCLGLVDVTGRELLSQKYGKIRKYNERYILAYIATEEITENTGAALFEISYGSMKNHYYIGTMYLFDTKTNTLTNCNSTSYNQFWIKGSFIHYRDENGNYITVDKNGDPISEEMNVMDNGCYSMPNGNTSTVYDENGNSLFDLDGVRYNKIKSKGNYFSHDNILYDRTGNIVFEAPGTIASVVGNLVAHSGEDGIYKYSSINGNEIEGTYYGQKNYVYVTRLENNSEFAFVDDEGTLVAKVSKDLCTDTAQYLCIYDKDYRDENKATNKKYYCVKDQNFSILANHYPIAPWIVKSEKENGKADAVCVISGEAILTDYVDYTSFFYDFRYNDNLKINDDIYIAAETVNGTYDFYRIEK